MAQIYKEVHHTSAAGDDEVVEKRVDVTHEDRGILRLQNIVYTLVGVLEALLGIRLLLALFGANPSNAFANFIYDVSQPFVAPFQGLFNYTFEGGVSRFEIETLVAMIVYALVGWIIVSIVGLAKKEPEA